MVKKQKKTQTASTKPSRSFEDFKTALLIVSLLINLAFFIGWLAIRLSTDYDDQVFHLLFDR